MMMQADDASVTGGSPGQTGTVGDTDEQSTTTGVMETQIGMPISAVHETAATSDQPS